MAHTSSGCAPTSTSRTPAEFEGRSTGYSGDAVVDEAGGSVQMGFRDRPARRRRDVDAHVHSFEESIYVIDGTPHRSTPTEGSFELAAGDYGLIPVGMTHAFANTSGAVVEFAEMKAPLPRERFGFDTQFPARARDRAGDADRRAGPAQPLLRPHRRRVDGSGDADPGPPRREREHADRAARLQRDQREDDGRLRPRRRPVHDVHGPVRAGRVRRRARPSPRGGLPDPRGRGRGRLRRRPPTGSAPATSRGPASAACTSSATSARAGSAGWRRRRRSHRRATRIDSPATGPTSRPRSPIRRRQTGKGARDGRVPRSDQPRARGSWGSTGRTGSTSSACASTGSVACGRCSRRSTSARCSCSRPRTSATRPRPRSATGPSTRASAGRSSRARAVPRIWDFGSAAKAHRLQLPHMYDTENSIGGNTGLQGAIGPETGLHARAVREIKAALEDAGVGRREARASTSPRPRCSSRSRRRA